MLSLSSDRKTAPSCKWEANQRRWKPRTLNAIGFPAVTTCPSRTPTCEADCYAKRVPYPSALKLLERNRETLDAHGANAARKAQACWLPVLAAALVFLPTWALLPLAAWHLTNPGVMRPD